MKEGRTRKENQVGRDFAILVVILVFAFLYFFHDDPRDLDNLDPPHVANHVSPPAPMHSESRPEINKFTIVINNVEYSQSSTISPKTPISAVFHHDNAAVTKIRMQHPRNPQTYIEYPLNQDVGLDIHAEYMRKNVYSSSLFLAMDRSGRVYDEILIEFSP